MQFKPRNPFVPLALKRKAGTHQKPEKAKRQQEKMALMKMMKKFYEQLLLATVNGGKQKLPGW